MQVTVLKEDARGCGFRKSGKDGYGLYLMGSLVTEPCERLPFQIGRCPCCGEGVKFSRGFTWILPKKLFASSMEPTCYEVGMPQTTKIIVSHDHSTCYMCNPSLERQGLMWVGEKFYSPGDFAMEAMFRGVSKRIASVPRGFVIGEHIVYLAHNKAVHRDGDEPEKPGVFIVFKPTHLDIVVDTTAIEDVPAYAITLVETLGDKARLVKVEKTEQLSLLTGQENDFEEE